MLLKRSVLWYPELTPLRNFEANQLAKQWRCWSFASVHFFTTVAAAGTAR